MEKGKTLFCRAPALVTGVGIAWPFLFLLFHFRFILHPLRTVFEVGGALTNCGVLSGDYIRRHSSLFFPGRSFFHFSTPFDFGKMGITEFGYSAHRERGRVEAVGYGQATRLLGVGARRGVFWGQRGTRDCQSDRRPPGTDGLPRDCQSFTPSCTARRKGDGTRRVPDTPSGVRAADGEVARLRSLGVTRDGGAVEGLLAWERDPDAGFLAGAVSYLVYGFCRYSVSARCHRATSGFMYTACRGTIQRCFLGQERFWRGARSRCPRDNAGKRALLDKPAVVPGAGSSGGRSAGERPINIRTLGMRSLG